MADRELPNNVEMEAGLLSIFLHDEKGETIDKCLEQGLKPSLFFDKKLRLILCACLELYSDCEPINKEGAIAVLTRRGKLEDAGGENLIENIESRKEDAVYASHYVEVIKDKAFRRRLIKTTQKAVEANFPDKATQEEILDTITKMFLTAGKNITADDVAEAQACRKLVHDKVRALFDEAKERGFHMRGTLRLLTRLVERLNRRARGE